MLLKPDDERLRDSRRPKPAPVEFAGQWVAWDEQRTKIVANGADFGEVHEAAKKAGCLHPLIEKVPQPCSFIGN